QRSGPFPKPGSAVDFVHRGKWSVYKRRTAKAHVSGLRFSGHRIGQARPWARVGAGTSDRTGPDRGTAARAQALEANRGRPERFGWRIQTTVQSNQQPFLPSPRSAWSDQPRLLLGTDPPKADPCLLLGLNHVRDS